MGCDIHVILEKKHKIKDSNNYAWIMHNNYRLKIDDDSECNNPDNLKPKLVTNDIGYRSYDLFGILAGVRSGITPLVEPRGLPKNCSNIVSSEYYDKKDSYYYHTPTWYNLKELIEFSNNLKCDIDEDEFDSKHEYKEYVDYWTDSVYDNLKTFIADIIDYIFNHDIEFDFSSDTPEYENSVQYFYNECNPENYRVIIWFDN
jgi:hypothetical protein